MVFWLSRWILLWKKQTHTQKVKRKRNWSGQFRPKGLDIVVSTPGDVPVSAPYLRNFPPFSHPSGVADLMEMIYQTWVKRQTGESVGLFLGRSLGRSMWKAKTDSNTNWLLYVWYFQYPPVMSYFKRDSETDSRNSIISKIYFSKKLSRCLMEQQENHNM